MNGNGWRDVLATQLITATVAFGTCGVLIAATSSISPMPVEAQIQGGVCDDCDEGSAWDPEEEDSIFSHRFDSSGEETRVCDEESQDPDERCHHLQYVGPCDGGAHDSCEEQVESVAAKTRQLLSSYERSQLSDHAMAQHIQNESRLVFIPEQGVLKVTDCRGTPFKFFVLKPDHRRTLERALLNVAQSTELPLFTAGTVAVSTTRGTA